MITEIDAKLLEKIADLTGKPAGAFNIRKDMGCEARQSTEHIAIDPGRRQARHRHPFQGRYQGRDLSHPRDHQPDGHERHGVQRLLCGRRLRREHRGRVRHPQLRLRRKPPRRHPHLPHRQKLPGPLHGEALRRGRPGRDRQKRDESPRPSCIWGRTPPCRWTPSRSGASTPCGDTRFTVRPAARWWSRSAC